MSYSITPDGNAYEAISNKKEPVVVVVKGDHGPAFIARAAGDLLAAWGILRLHCPIAAAQYNDSCEAARFRDGQKGPL